MKMGKHSAPGCMGVILTTLAVTLGSFAGIISLIVR